MHLALNILNGPRAGTSLELSTAGEQSSSQIYVLEDEALHILLRLEQEYGQLSLMLHDTEVFCTSSRKIGDLWEYEWVPKSLPRWGYECFFHNYYGLAELALVSRDSDNDEMKVIVQFNPLEVMARRTNAERVDRMLEFLASHDSDALAAFFRVTRIRAGFKEGDKAVNFLIEQLERNVELLKSEIPRICSRPIAKLHPATKIMTVTENLVIDDTTLAWLSDNTDSLFPVEDPQLALLIFEDDLYGASKVLENHIQDDVDIYENQVIHGFIETLLRAASDILKGLEVKPSSRMKNKEVSGYLSFFSQLNRFAKIINRNKIERCRALILTLHGLKLTLEQDLPVMSSKVGPPLFTQKARYNIHYQRVFHKIIAWHRFGAPDWSVQEELFSIQSVPKLFEYYVLFVIKYHLDNLELDGDRLEPINKPSIKHDEFEYRWGGACCKAYV